MVSPLRFPQLAEIFIIFLNELKNTTLKIFTPKKEHNSSTFSHIKHTLMFIVQTCSDLCRGFLYYVFRLSHFTQHAN